MAFDYARIINLHRELAQTYTTRDTILYALGVGAGIDANAPAQLRYVYEENLKALPTMAVVLAYPGLWLREPEFKADWSKILHAEQSVIFHRPLPVAGSVKGILKVEAVYDKGADKGALVYFVRELFDDASGDHLATIRQGSFLRGDGGAGGLKEGAPKPHALPEGKAADSVIVLPTRLEQALIYRLSGDYNPLHADPEVARKAGFPRPILHGLLTYGIVGRALIAGVCGGDESKLRRLDVRFSSPVYPGEEITTEIWRESPGKAGFRAKVAARDTVVINNGYAEFD